MAPTAASVAATARKQPSYTFKVDSRQMSVNNSFEENPATSMLFHKLSPAEFRMHLLKLNSWWFYNWLLILALFIGGIGKVTFTIVQVYIVLRYMILAHDTVHMIEDPPLLAAVCKPILGFLPVTMTYGDSKLHHVKYHHLENKAVLDHHDNDSRWGSVPFLASLIGMFFYPGSNGPYEVVYYYFHGHAHVWPERIFGTLFYWLQLCVLYQMGLLWTVLLAGHLGSYATMLFLHGILHRASWFSYIIWADPSGKRRLPVLDTLMYGLFGYPTWMELKWHDVHHSHGLGMGSISVHMEVRGIDPETAEEAFATMVDEGLFVDSAGQKTSLLEDVGHRVGARQEYLKRGVPRATAATVRAGPMLLGGRAPAVEEKGKK
eukprot:TRINITY_DN3734_c0_g1_i1.p1 TRINITY_DN3734_c0_g1~~TRINITY_DN3734_c0_g1_i1.p1  ORF type:complete len:401 (+),score=72.70 TRINITY_DN3734_c0_g1_i1:77-1204(+)